MKIILTEKQLELIEKKIIQESDKKKPTTTDEILKFQSWVINTKKDKTILGKGGKSNFGDDGNFGPNTQIAWEKYGEEYSKSNKTNKSDKNKNLTPATSFAQIAQQWFKKFTSNKNPEKNSSLFFNGNKLIWLSNGSEIKSWNATSGVNMLNATPDQYLDLIKKPFIPSKELQSMKNFGPIPEGSYTVGKLQTSKLEKTNPFMDLVKAIFRKKEWDHDWNTDKAGTRISWGYYRALITANRGTNSYGRSSYYIHGGLLPASHGCIDLTSEMEDFAKFYSAWATKYKKNSIQMKVKYSKRFIDYFV